MIKTLSPHYKTIPWISPSSGTTPDKYILELYVWKGDKTSVPVTAQYELENVNPLERTGNSKVNISNYINDFIDYNLVQSTTTGLIATDMQVWVKSQVIYYISDVAQSPEFVDTDIAMLGYGYGMSGENPSTPTNGVLSSAEEVKVDRNGFYSLPVFLSETVTTDVTIISYPDRNINKSYSESLTIDSEDSVKLVWINVSEADNDEYIEINYNGSVVATLLIKDELRYSPKDIFFFNKEGQLQSITFFKEKIDTLEITGEKYESSNGQPKDGVHQFVDFNQNGKTTFKVNSGFQSEDNNELIRQLLLIKTCWIYDGNLYTPARVTKSSIEYKTRQKDRLINYEVEFEYAFSEINNI